MATSVVRQAFLQGKSKLQKMHFLSKKVVFFVPGLTFLSDFVYFCIFIFSSL